MAASGCLCLEWSGPGVLYRSSYDYYNVNCYLNAVTKDDGPSCETDSWLSITRSALASWHRNNNRFYFTILKSWGENVVFMFVVS